MSAASHNDQTMTSPPPSTKPESATTDAPPSSPPSPAGKAEVGTITKLKKWLVTSTKQKKWLIAAVVVLVGAGAGYAAWLKFRSPEVPEGFARSNGRIEATEVDIATKLPGRVLDELVDEGDLVTAGQVVAHMNVDVLTAQLNEARAQRDVAKSNADAARSVLAQRESEKAAAESRLAQREASLKLAASKFARRQALVKKGGASQEELETEESDFHSAEAAVSSAKADVAAADAAIATAKAQIIAAESSIAYAVATIERVQADIDDSTLKSPRDGRVQYRVAQPGEVLSAGGKVLNLVGIADVYMTFFLPTDWAGRASVGAETRLVFDAAPQFVIPAKVTFVADVAQFTPKTVETAEERQKLTFRVKAHISPELLKKQIRHVKTGLPGVAYVQLDPQAPWPAHLQLRLPLPEQ
jgi:HlyD family secretion protein